MWDATTTTTTIPPLILTLPLQHYVDGVRSFFRAAPFMGSKPSACEVTMGTSSRCNRQSKDVHNTNVSSSSRAPNSNHGNDISGGRVAATGAGEVDDGMRPRPINASPGTIAASQSCTTRMEGVDAARAKEPSNPANPHVQIKRVVVIGLPANGRKKGSLSDREWRAVVMGNEAANAATLEANRKYWKELVKTAAKCTANTAIAHSHGDSPEEKKAVRFSDEVCQVEFKGGCCCPDGHKCQSSGCQKRWLSYKWYSNTELEKEGLMRAQEHRWLGYDWDKLPEDGFVPLSRVSPYNIRCQGAGVWAPPARLAPRLCEYQPFGISGEVRGKKGLDENCPSKMMHLVPIGDVDLLFLWERGIIPTNRDISPQDR